LSPILREQFYSLPRADLEPDLSGFAGFGLDRQRDGAIGLDRLLRLARQAVLAGLRQSQEFAIAAADVSTAAV
jgi:hypothetical protein